jgi:D-alanyl-D-alanine carboxypeptidase/D-alanyl-D-alanine-endopeptidase (penicillin-binding protein 4)
MFNEAFAPTHVEVEGIVDTVQRRPLQYRNFLDAFVSALNERGVVVRESYDWTSRVADSSLTPLFTYQSAPLWELLPHFLKPSQNQIGEILLRTMGLARTGVGSADSGAAVVLRRALTWGVDSTGLVMRDGSGLSRHDLLSPESVIRVLGAMRRDSLFNVFHAAFPVAGVDGTLERRLRGTLAAGNVRGKTGSMDRVRAFSGYATTVDGRMMIFSLMANAFPGPGSDVDTAMDTIVARIASLTGSR